jgi:hypothetical protein
MFAACIEINPVKQSVTGKLIVPKRVWNGFKYRFWYKTPRAGRSEPLKKITDAVAFDPRFPCLSLTASLRLARKRLRGRGACLGDQIIHPARGLLLSAEARSHLCHVSLEGVGMSLTAVGCANACAGAAHKRRGPVGPLWLRSVIGLAR